MTSASPVILLVEDDPDDVFFLRDAFAKNGMPGAPRVVRDGEEALAYLLGQGPYADRSLHPLPALVLLDLKLPRASGHEVLERRRQRPELMRIPVVVLTSSESDDDTERAYAAGANSYLVKPVSSAAQAGMVKTLLEYWLGLNKAPAPAPRG